MLRFRLNTRLAKALRTCAPLCALALLAPSAATGARPTSAASENAAEAELLLEVRLGGEVLSGALIATQSGRHVLLPLGEMARLLTLGIRVDAARGRARGFVLQEERIFDLDLAAGAVIHDGKSEVFDPQLVQRRSDDIYVASELLARWWPVTLAVDFSTLVLAVQATEPLPLQQRLDRERRGERLNGGPNAEERDYPLRPLPHRMWSVPSVDLAVGMEATGHDGRTATRSDFSAYMTGDLLGLDSTIYLNGSSEGSSLPSGSRARITLGRVDPDAGLLGPLRARSFAFGSVSVPQLANVSRTSPLGTGFAVGNTPLLLPLGLGRHSLEGDLPPGWDVELYINDALTGMQASGGTGRYVFDDLPMLYGNNEFRLVFHGPQGQTRVERQVLLLDQSLLRPGDFHYRFAAHEDLRGGQRALGQFGWGLTQHLSATAGVATLPLAGVDQRYVNAGLRAQLLSMFLTGDVVRAERGTLGELALHTRLGPVNVALGRTALTEGFASEEFLPGVESVRFRDRLRLDSVIPVAAALKLPVTLEVKRDRLRSGRTNLETGLRVSGAWRGLAVTTSLRRLMFAGLSSTRGTLQLSSRFGALGVRGGFGYALSGDRRVSDGSLSLEYRLGQGLLLNAGVARSMDTAQTTTSIGLTKSVGSYGLRVAAGTSASGDVRIGVQFLVSAVREPRAGDWRFDALPMSDSASVSARVFLDRNLNGIEDGDDEPLPNIAFRVNGGRHPARTDENGAAWLPRLPVRQYVDVAIDPGTLEDPQWSPVTVGTRLVPRPGGRHSLDFAVMLTSEIDGTVRIADEPHSRGLGGIELELVDAQRQVVARATTASDGFYIVEAVPPGTYRLRVAHEQLVPLGLIDTGVRIVTVDANGDFVSGVDFDLIADWTEAGRRDPERARTVTQADAL